MVPLVRPPTELVSLCSQFRARGGVSIAMGSNLEPLPESKTAGINSEVSRAVSSPQKGGQAGQVSPMSSVWIAGEAPVCAVQAMRRAAEAQVTPEAQSSVLRRVRWRNVDG